MVPPEVVNRHIDYRDEEVIGQPKQVVGYSNRVVEGDTEKTARAPEAEARLENEKIVQIHVEYLLPVDTGCVDSGLLRTHRHQDGDQHSHHTVDQVEEDGQPGLAEPLGRAVLTDQDVPVDSRQTRMYL